MTIIQKLTFRSLLLRAPQNTLFLKGLHLPYTSRVLHLHFALQQRFCTRILLCILRFLNVLQRWIGALQYFLNSRGTTTLPAPGTCQLSPSWGSARHKQLWGPEYAQAGPALKAAILQKEEAPVKRLPVNADRYLQSPQRKKCKQVFVQTCGLTWKLRGVYGAILEMWFREGVSLLFHCFFNTIFFC